MAGYVLGSLKTLEYQDLLSHIRHMPMFDLPGAGGQCIPKKLRNTRRRPVAIPTSALINADEALVPEAAIW